MPERSCRKGLASSSYLSAHLLRANTSLDFEQVTSIGKSKLAQLFKRTSSRRAVATSNDRRRRRELRIIYHYSNAVAFEARKLKWHLGKLSAHDPNDNKLLTARF
jgi:hypothetical protein